MKPQVKQHRVSLAGSLALDQRGRDVAPILADELSNLGYEIVDVGPVELLINLNHNWKSLREQTKHGSVPTRILIRLEPPSVFPAQYTPKVEETYDLLFNPGRPQQSREDFIPWPYQFQKNPLKPQIEPPSVLEILNQKFDDGQFDYNNWRERQIFCAMISANKISPNGSGNYELRRTLAKNLKDPRLQIFGELWRSSLSAKLRYRLGVLRFALVSRSEFSLRAILNDTLSRYPRTFGEIEDKHAILKDSKFSFVIENSGDYVSEKLLDSLIEGCIPIYIGPHFEGTNLPEELVIRTASAPEGLMDFLEGLNPETIKNKLSTIREFLLSPSFLEWEATLVYRTIAQKIDAKYREGK
jgi:hypothetical protein